MKAAVQVADRHWLEPSAEVIHAAPATPALVQQSRRLARAPLESLLVALLVEVWPEAPVLEEAECRRRLQMLEVTLLVEGAAT